jgi:hypothetical protein
MLIAPRPGVDAHQIGQIQRRFAEQPRPALVLQHQQPPLDRADRFLRDQPVAAEIASAFSATKVSSACRSFRSSSGSALRPTAGRPRSARPPAARTVPEAATAAAAPSRPRWRGPGGPSRRTDPRRSPESARYCRSSRWSRTRGKASCSLPCGVPAWQMPDRSPFTSDRKTGTPAAEKPLGQRLQRHGLAGSGGPRDQPVAVAVFEQQVLRQAIALAPATHEDRPLGRHRRAPCIRFHIRTIQSCVRATRDIRRHAARGNSIPQSHGFPSLSYLVPAGRKPLTQS